MRGSCLCFACRAGRKRKSSALIAEKGVTHGKSDPPADAIARSERGFTQGVFRPKRFLFVQGADVAQVRCFPLVRTRLFVLPGLPIGSFILTNPVDYRFRIDG